MRGGDGGLSKLGVALVIIFAISLLAIFAQVFYVLWRRRRTGYVGGVGEEVFRQTSSESAFSSIGPSKELLYFFCIRPQYRLDRSSLTANSRVNETNSNHEEDVQIIDMELLKIEGVLGRPRFLFTIKEEEREGMDSPAKTTLCPAENETMKKNEVDDENGSLEEYVRAAEDATMVAMETEIDDHSDATAFSTPCASPVYFTPSASPVHEAVNGRSTDTITSG